MRLLAAPEEVAANIYPQVIQPMRALYAALLLGYTIHFIYCIWGNLRITVAELIAACILPLIALSDSDSYSPMALCAIITGNSVAGAVAF